MLLVNIMCTQNPRKKHCGQAFFADNNFAIQMYKVSATVKNPFLGNAYNLIRMNDSKDILTDEVCKQ